MEFTIGIKDNDTESFIKNEMIVYIELDKETIETKIFSKLADPTEIEKWINSVVEQYKKNLELKSTNYEHWFYMASIIRIMAMVGFDWHYDIQENKVYTKVFGE